MSDIQFGQKPEPDDKSKEEEEFLFGRDIANKPDDKSKKEEDFLEDDEFASELRKSIVKYVKQFTKLQDLWSEKIIYWIEASILILIVVLTTGGCYTMLCPKSYSHLDTNLCSFFKYLTIGLIVQILGLGAIATRYLFSNANFEHAIDALKDARCSHNLKK